jgi:hypothetical protein
MRSRVVILLALLCASLALPANVGAARSRASTPAAVISVGSRLGDAIPKDFLGFSIESSTLCRILELDQAEGPAYEQLFKNLGPGVIHVGGHSSEFARFEPAGTPRCGVNNTVYNAKEIQQFFSFVKAIGWHVVWGLPLLQFHPHKATVVAEYVHKVGGSALLDFSLGNEPDLYGRYGASHTWDQYIKQWNKEHHDIASALPRVTFIGPEECCVSSYLTDFASAEHKRIKALSFHYYAGSQPKYGPLTIKWLMSAAARAKFIKRVKYLRYAAATQYHLPLYLTETNTFADGGVDGVSNSFAAGLWMSDMLFTEVTHHITMANVQQSAGQEFYNPITPLGTVSPVYYGMLLFRAASFVPSRPTADSRLLPITNQTDRNDLDAYAVRGGDGSLRVVVVNKDGHDAHIRIVADHPYEHAADYVLSAPNVGATNGVTLGGAAVMPDGTWTPTPQTLNQHGTTLKVNVRHHSAAVIVLSSSQAHFAYFSTPKHWSVVGANGGKLGIRVAHYVPKFIGDIAAAFRAEAPTSTSSGKGASASASVLLPTPKWQKMLHEHPKQSRAKLADRVEAWISHRLHLTILGTGHMLLGSTKARTISAETNAVRVLVAIASVNSGRQLHVIIAKTRPSASWKLYKPDFKAIISSAVLV